MNRHLLLRTVCALADIVFVVLAIITVAILAGTSHDADSGASTTTVLGRTVFVVRSGSMVPTLGVGDLLVADAAVDAGSIGIGEVIVFRRRGPGNEMLVSHRVTDTWRTPDGLHWFTTRGDANRSPDAGAVRGDQIVARMTGRLPKAGYVLTALKNTGAMALFGLGAVLAHAALLIARTADSPGGRRRTRGTTPQQKGIT